VAGQIRKQTRVIAFGVAHHSTSVILSVYFLVFLTNFFFKILGAKEFVDAIGLGRFLAGCQFKFGGISKAPGEHPGT